MKKINTNNRLLIMICLTCILSCNKPDFKEVVSNKEVCLVQANLKADDNRLILLIPLELELDLNYKCVKDVGIYYVVDGKGLNQPHTFTILNGDRYRMNLAIQDLNYETYPKRIYLLNRTWLIDNPEAQELIDRYNPSTKLADIKDRNDTIKLAPYSVFREDYPKLLAYLREKPDFVTLSLGLSGGEAKVLEKQIKW